MIISHESLLMGREEISWLFLKNFKRRFWEWKKEYLSISDNYFHYATNNKNVHFYKVYKNDELIGTTHLEQQENVLFMDVLVFPKFQRAGLGTSIVKDIQDDIFELGYKSIEISIDEENIGSLRLFEKAGFAFVSKEAELLNFVYKKDWQITIYQAV